MFTASPHRPDWNHLFKTAVGQEGLFTTRQAAEAGYSPQLLVHYVHRGRVARVLHGIYRLVHFPAVDHEELVTAWLWSDLVGVVSHQTALSLHGLSDALPSKVHLTLPLAWRKRRLRVPEGIVLHYADVSQQDRSWFEAVPITSPGRSLVDCAHDGLSPDLLQQAAQQAVRRGLVAKAQLDDVNEALKPFGKRAA